jgi:transposase-like protein
MEIMHLTYPTKKAHTLFMAGIIAKQYQDEDAARKHLEAIRWPEGPICPHCDSINQAFKLKGKTTRKGLWKCSVCREPFTVTIGTIFEDSKIPLHKWLLAVHLMCSSKKGISAHQLWRNLWGVSDTGKQLGSYRTAWFMAHRVRWAMHQEPMAGKLAGVVEVDETYVGGKEPGMVGKPGRTSKKTAVVAMVERSPDGKGRVKSVVMERVTADNLRTVLRSGIEQQATLNTDESSMYAGIGRWWKEHETVNHGRKEYVRFTKGAMVTTNTIEGYFGILKRGINGVFHHVGKHHLHRYLSEFDFRYNNRKTNDLERTILAMKETSGKRLMLKQPKGSE